MNKILLTLLLCLLFLDFGCTRKKYDKIHVYKIIDTAKSTDNDVVYSYLYVAVINNNDNQPVYYSYTSKNKDLTSTDDIVWNSSTSSPVTGKTIASEEEETVSVEELPEEAQANIEENNTNNSTVTQDEEEDNNSTSVSTPSNDDDESSSSSSSDGGGDDD